MILRSAEDGTRLLIAQTSHALLSGQMMAAWGPPGFARPDPAPEVILAAGQHDTGCLSWETAPFTRLGAGRSMPPCGRGGAKVARAAWGL